MQKKIIEVTASKEITDRSIKTIYHHENASPIYLEFSAGVFELQPALIGIKLDREVLRDGNKIVTLINYCPNKMPPKEEEVLEYQLPKNSKFLQILYSRIDKANRQLNDAQRVSERECSNESLAVLFEETKKFTAFLLDLYIPHSRLKELISSANGGCEISHSNEEITRLMLFPFSGRNVMLDVYIGLLRFALIRRRTQESYQHFAETLGYLDARDIYPTLETREQIEEAIKTASSSFCSAGEIEVEIAKLKQQSLENRIQAGAMCQSVLRNLRGAERKLAASLLYYSRFALDFDDTDRRLRSKSFKIFREALIRKGLPLEIEFEELLNAYTN